MNSNSNRIAKKLRISCAACLIIVPALVFGASLAGEDMVDILSRGKMTDPASGVLLSWSTDPDMFPHAWREPPVSGRAVPVARRKVEKQLDGIMRAMARYPADLLGRTLKRVYLLQELSFYGLAYGGTWSFDRIYLVSVAHDFRQAEGSFHHEYSSILLSRYSRYFARSRWLKTLPSGVEYRLGGLQALRRGETGLVWSPRFHRQGFLCEYGQAALEEDFNTFAEALFMGRGLFMLAEGYPLIQRKLAITLDFYKKLSPLFTRQYFVNLERENRHKLKARASTEHYRLKNGILRREKLALWIAELDNGQRYQFQLVGQDRHYIYLIDRERDVYIGLPRAGKKDWLYLFRKNKNNKDNKDDESNKTNKINNANNANNANKLTGDSGQNYKYIRQKEIP